MPLQITTILADAIRRHAADDYPHECCGFLVGSARPGAAGQMSMISVARALPAANTRQDSPRNRFEIDPAEMMRVDRAARAEGLGVVGFYHSHPDAPARPSDYDREHAWPEYCYVIVSVQAGQPTEMRNWRLRDDRSGFDSDPIFDSDF